MSPMPAGLMGFGVKCTDGRSARAVGWGLGPPSAASVGPGRLILSVAAITPPGMDVPRNGGRGDGPARHPCL
jgi:hypothetical protein